MKFNLIFAFDDHLQMYYVPKRNCISDSICDINIDNGLLVIYVVYYGGWH